MVKQTTVEQIFLSPAYSPTRILRKVERRKTQLLALASAAVAAATWLL
jgi:hypothetical protein